MPVIWKRPSANAKSMADKKADKPKADKPQGKKPKADKPQGKKPKADKPSADAKAAADKKEAK